MCIPFFDASMGVKCGCPGRYFEWSSGRYDSRQKYNNNIMFVEREQCTFVSSPFIITLWKIERYETQKTTLSLLEHFRECIFFCFHLKQTKSTIAKIALKRICLRSEFKEVYVMRLSILRNIIEILILYCILYYTQY